MAEDKIVEQEMFYEDSYNPKDYEKEVEVFNENLTAEEIDKRIQHVNIWGKFQPTFYQYEFFEHFTERDEDGRLVKHKEGVAVIPRRHGKSVSTIACVILPRMLEVKGTYLHIFPSLTQGRGAIWNGMGKITRDEDEQAINYLELIPRSLWKRKNNAEMSLELINGSVYRIVGVMGKDNTPNHLRGYNPVGIIADEFGEWSKDFVSVIFSPIIGQNGGFIFKIGTPKGENQFYKDYCHAKAAQLTDNRVKAWHYSCVDLYYNDGSRIIDDEFIQRELARGVEPEVIAQEYYCDFKSAMSAAYYKVQIKKAEEEGRITKIEPDDQYPAFAFWDLGKNGTNAVWVFRFPNEQRIDAIKFDCDPNLPLYEMHMKLRQVLPYPIEKHYYPWDGNSQESTGLTKVEFVRSKGINDDIEVVPRLGSVQDGIDYAKSIFHRIWFDETECHHGVNCLKNYVKQMNITTQNFGDPLKNQFIHGADAFRTMATAMVQGLIPIGKRNPVIWEMRQRDDMSSAVFEELKI